MSWLIDTNVLSEPSKPRADRRAVAWLQAQDPSFLFVSALTLGEIQKGATRLPAGQKKDRLLDWLHHDVRLRFARRIVAIDEAVALCWGTLVAEVRRTLPLADSLLAATALTHDLTLATRNLADFRDTGVRLFNPWEYEP